MLNTVTVQEAAANLPQLIDSLRANDEIILTDGQRPVARIVPAGVPFTPRRPGSARGMLTVIAEDDDHLEEFREYMP